jgi:hypothetical protein
MIKPGCKSDIFLRYFRSNCHQEKNGGDPQQCESCHTDPNEQVTAHCLWRVPGRSLVRAGSCVTVQAVAHARYGFYQVFFRVVIELFAEYRNATGKAFFRCRATLPGFLQQGFLADHVIRMFQQAHQHIAGLRLYMFHRTVLVQFARLGTEAYRSNLVGSHQADNPSSLYWLTILAEKLQIAQIVISPISSS